MNKTQAQQALNLANVAIDTVRKIAIQEQELLGTHVRDPRYVRVIIALQEKKQAVENFLERIQSNG
mgnify:CR=1 FL=1